MTDHGIFSALTKHWEEEYHRDMAALNVSNLEWKPEGFPTIALPSSLSPMPSLHGCTRFSEPILLSGQVLPPDILTRVSDYCRVHTRISTRFRLHTFQSRFEFTSRGGLNPDSFKSYATGNESCERSLCPSSGQVLPPDILTLVNPFSSLSLSGQVLPPDILTLVNPFSSLSL